jgi:DNA-directed RNA polymerase specialized sigma24 family protein
VQPTQDAEDWRTRALSQWELINRLATRRFRQQPLAEEAALFVVDRLAEDDWRRLRTFSGRSSFTAFVAALSLRLLEDFSRLRFGRAKPPLWVRRLGGVWMALFRLLCLERRSPAEAAALLAARQLGDERHLETTAYQLLGELPSCGEARGEITGLDEDLAAAEIDTNANQEQRLEEEERDGLFAVLGRIVFGEGAGAADERLLARVSEAGIELAPRERLLLQLCFRDGLPVAEAGRMLGWNRHQTHGRLRRLLARIREDLTRAGLAEELRLLL